MELRYKIEEAGSELRDDGVIINQILVDSNNDFHFSSVIVNGKDIFSFDSTTFRDIVNQIIFEYSNKVNKFVSLVDIGEAFLSTSRYMFDKSHDNISTLIDVFNKKNLLNRLVWRSNGLNPDFKTEIKFEPISNFLGLNIDMCFEITPRNFSHNFLSLYRAYKPIREEFHCFLEQSGVINKTLYSYNSEYNTTSPWSYDYKVSLEDKSVTAPMLMKPGEYFKQTFCSIVYEAFWVQETVFFTEKINKCFLTGHPFIVVSCPKYLDYLKKLGFKTFSNWWDESYDNILDNREREVKLKQLILKISEWDLNKCQDVYKEMIPTLKHNQKILKDIASQRTDFGYTVLKFKSEII